MISYIEKKRPYNYRKMSIVDEKLRGSSANSDEIAAKKWKNPLTEIYDKLCRKEKSLLL
jgi:hypothetical protein